MQISELVTKQDLTFLEERIVTKLSSVLQKDSKPQKNLIRTKELKQMTGLSDSGLQNLRVNGVLPYYKVQGALFYDLEEVMAVFEKHKVIQ